MSLYEAWTLKRGGGGGLAGSGTNGKLAKWSGGALANSIIQESSGMIGINGEPSTVFEVISDGPADVPLFNTSFGTTSAGFVGRRARGSFAAPTAVQADDLITQIEARGYGATAFASASRGRFGIKANQNWTDANQGTYLSLEVTPNNTATVAEHARLTATDFTLDTSLSFGATPSAPDLFLVRDAANNPAFRNGTSPTLLSIYNTYSSSGANYERAEFGWSGNQLYIGTAESGTGVARQINFEVANATKWFLSTAGDWKPGTDAVNQFGDSTHRVKQGWFGGSTETASNPILTLAQTWNAGGVTFTSRLTNITDSASAAGSLFEDWRVAGVSKASLRKDGQFISVAGVTLTGSLDASGHVRAGTYIDFGSAFSVLRGSTTDGIIKLSNQAETDFTRLQFGGTSSSFTAIGRNGTFAEFQLADASNRTGIQCQQIVFGNTVGSGTYLMRVGVNPGGIAMASTQNLIWSSSATDQGAGNDTNVSRVSAGVIGIGTGTQGSVAGTLNFTTATMVGKIGTYNNVTTAGWGVPAIYAAGRATAQTAANASVSTYTCGAADGTFLVSANVLVTTSSAESFTVTVSYTDEGNTARVLTLNFSILAGTLSTAIAFANGAVPYEGVPTHIRCKASTTITIKTAAGGTYTGCTYNVEGLIQQLA